MVKMTGNSSNTASAYYIRSYITYSKFSFCWKISKISQISKKYHDIFYIFDIFENIMIFPILPRKHSHGLYIFCFIKGNLPSSEHTSTLLLC